MKNQVQSFLVNQIIREIASPVPVQLYLLGEKISLRICINYQALNERTKKKTSILIPTVDESLDAL